MDVSYLLIALRSIRDDSARTRPWQYNQALDWIINHIETNWDTFDAILDGETEEATDAGPSRVR